MTKLRELAQQSGLSFADSNDNSRHRPQWNANDWPPLLGGYRCDHASVVLDDPENERAQTIVVLGGRRTCEYATNSILMLNLNEQNPQWREGPALTKGRRDHAAVVCNGGVYVMGGSGGDPLDSIERTDVEDLLAVSSVTSRNGKLWTTLNCRLSTARCGCCAVAVYNRYIVVIGGFNPESSYLSSVEIIDTAIQSNHTIISGPSMALPRSYCASVVIDHRIFLVGGYNRSSGELAWVETLQFEERSNDETNETACTVFPASATWTTYTGLTRSTATCHSVAVALGSCIILGEIDICKPELFDTERNIVWNLPPLTTDRNSSSMVAFNNGIAVIGGYRSALCETLPLIVDKKEHLKVRFLFHIFVSCFTLGRLGLSDIISCFCDLQRLYSCREELDKEMENLQNVIDRAQIERSDIKVLQEAAKAEKLHSILQSLCTDEKYLSVEHIQDEINTITSQLDRINVIKDKIPRVAKLKKLESQLELTQLTQNDRKLPGHPVRSTRRTDSCVSEDDFFKKLVEVDCNDVVFKVHDLSLLVYDVHQMKVFYIFLNHLYRSKRMSKDERQRYTMKALQETFKNIDKTDQQVLTMHERIVEKCRQDGVFVSGFDNNETDSVAAITDPMSSLPNKLAMTEFRVGEILHHTSTQSLSTTNIANESIVHSFVLAQAQALGRSLKDVYAALDAYDANGASTGAICSILNALSFGQTIFRHVSSETLATPLLDDIVDYGDVSHICSVVYESGNEKLQNAFQQGIAIVEGAMLSFEMEDDATRDHDKAGMNALVSVIGQLANAVTKWTRNVTSIEVDDIPETVEAISLLALVVTAKMIQTVTEESLEGEQIIPSHDKVDSAHASKRKKRKGSSSFSREESSSDVAPEIVENAPLTTFPSCLVERAREGHTTAVIGQQVTRMEESIAWLQVVERMTRLEESMASLMDELKGKKSSEDRNQVQMEQLEQRLCQLEETLGNS